MEADAIPRVADGGRLPFSPIDLLVDPHDRSKQGTQGEERFLNSGDNDEEREEEQQQQKQQQQVSTYLVDKDGNEYDPNSLAWRYLGVYIDCEDEGGDGNRARDLEDENANGNENENINENGCQRVLLWAAYHDPKYRGDSIGEYKFYDLSTKRWDKSSCKTWRCRRMDCHEPNTHFELVGVFKQYDGLGDWVDTLFQHEGSCIWDSDTYEIMSNERDRMNTNCLLLYITDPNGNSLYLDIKPEKAGNVALGVYQDDKCTVESKVSFGDYIVMYYKTYYGSEDQGRTAASFWYAFFDTWNNNMNAYKICQPCKAYDLGKYQDADQSSEAENRRFLDYDGGGSQEESDYNCYDDAGYVNVNQCYLFEAQTDLEPAYTQDLVKASAQGTILRIRVDGEVYGRGGFRSIPKWVSFFGQAVLVVALLAFIFHFFRKWLCPRTITAALPDSFRENLYEDKERKQRGPSRPMLWPFFRRVAKKALTCDVESPDSAKNGDSGAKQRLLPSESRETGKSLEEKTYDNTHDTASEDDDISMDTIERNLEDIIWSAFGGDDMSLPSAVYNLSEAIWPAGVPDDFIDSFDSSEEPTKTTGVSLANSSLSDDSNDSEDTMERINKIKTSKRIVDPIIEARRNLALAALVVAAAAAEGIPDTVDTQMEPTIECPCPSDEADGHRTEKPGSSNIPTDHGTKQPASVGEGTKKLETVVPPEKPVTKKLETSVPPKEPVTKKLETGVPPEKPVTKEPETDAPSQKPGFEKVEPAAPKKPSVKSVSFSIPESHIEKVKAVIAAAERKAEKIALRARTDQEIQRSERSGEYLKTLKAVITATEKRNTKGLRYTPARTKGPKFGSSARGADEYFKKVNAVLAAVKRSETDDGIDAQSVGMKSAASDKYLQTVKAIMTSMDNKKAKKVDSSKAGPAASGGPGDRPVSKSTVADTAVRTAEATGTCETKTESSLPEDKKEATLKERASEIESTNVVEAQVGQKEAQKAPDKTLTSSPSKDHHVGNSKVAQGLEPKATAVRPTEPGGHIRKVPFNSAAVSICSSSSGKTVKTATKAPKEASPSSTGEYLVKLKALIAAAENKEKNSGEDPPVDKPPVAGDS